MKLEDLHEAMSIADVSIAKARREGEMYVIDAQVEGVGYELTFYPAKSRAARFAGSGDNAWAFSFRIAPKHTVRRAVGKGEKGSGDQKDFKMQNFNSGMEFKVMPVMMGYIADFIRKLRPDAFMFAADKGEASRASLYRKIIKRYEPKLSELGYRAMTDKESHMDGDKDMQPFIFLRKPE